ncbi:hypothetical protein M1M15_gp07 [Vibrio phage XacF13]|nr:hypothetical protein M1M15_gp07 [Vibrio phage XacF13]QFQ33304.1 hypothetical protein XaF13_p07 [Vibrio phage XacF13]
MLICMSSLAGTDAQGKHKEASCTCMTEQGTAYDLDQPQCRTIAKRGPVYNPYRERRENEQQPAQQQQAVQGGAAAPGLSGVVVQRGMRTQGTFPESKGYNTKTTTPSTSLEM